MGTEDFTNDLIRCLQDGTYPDSAELARQHAINPDVAETIENAVVARIIGNATVQRNKQLKVDSRQYVRDCLGNRRHAARIMTAAQAAFKVSD